MISAFALLDAPGTTYLARKAANFLLGTDTPPSPTYGNLPGLNGYLEMQRLQRTGLL